MGWGWRRQVFLVWQAAVSKVALTHHQCMCVTPKSPVALPKTDMPRHAMPCCACWWRASIAVFFFTRASGSGITQDNCLSTKHTQRRNQPQLHVSAPLPHPPTHAWGISTQQHAARRLDARHMTLLSTHTQYHSSSSHAASLPAATSASTSAAYSSCNCCVSGPRLPVCVGLRVLVHRGDCV